LSIHVFLGPTLPRQDALSVLPGAVLYPPAAHGDLLRPGFTPSDVVVLVDGYYHHSAPVRHKEILALLSEGVPVIGCASMGALRAAELHPYGMAGSGVVFELYRDGLLDSDDEVAVTHAEGPEYRQLTVALVVLRHAAESARLAGVLSEAEARTVVELARSLHYTERSWGSLRSVAGDLESTLARLRSFMDGHPRHGDVKRSDTLDTLAKVARGELPGDPPPPLGEWRNRFVTEWQTQFSVTSVDNVEVGRSATMHYQQIYHDDFPTRWRRFALGHVAGTTDPHTPDDLARLALAAAARHGVTPKSLTAEQTESWLTPAETAELPAGEAVLRVLVRSFRSPWPTSALAAAEADLGEDPQAQRAVAEAHVINTEVASWASGQSVDQLKPAPLRAHLASVWRIDAADAPALLAGARDRGFTSTETAVDAVRPFFLRSRFPPVKSP
jgi:hypothetical protein